MVNFSSVNHRTSGAKNTAWLFWIFTYICSSHIELFTGSQFETWRRIHKISPYR